MDSSSREEEERRYQKENLAVLKYPKSLRGSRCSMEGLFFCMVLLLVITIAILGSTGFAFFVQASRKYSTVYRRDHFDIIYNRVTDLMNGVTILVDGMAASMSSGVLNFSTSSYEEIRDFTFQGLDVNFHLLDVDSITIYTANGGNVDQFISFSQYSDENLPRKMFRRFQGMDNTTKEIIAMCVGEVTDNGDCEPSNAFVDVDWARNDSITEQARYLDSPSFVPPYLFFCPGDYCDVFLAYAHPFHKIQGDSDSYVGVIGVAFETLTLKESLKENTKVGSSMIIDVKTKNMIASSVEGFKNFEYFYSNGTLEARQISASRHPDNLVRSMLEVVEEKSNGSLEYVDLNTHLQIFLGSRLYFVDYERFKENGADIVIINYTSSYVYVESIIFLGLILLILPSFSILVSVSLGICGTCLVKKPIRRLIKDLESVENLEIEPVRKEIVQRNFSRVKELYNLQKKFISLLQKLEMYKSFIPPHLKSSNTDSSIFSMDASDSSGLSILNPNLLEQHVSPRFFTIVNFVWKRKQVNYEDFIEIHSFLTKKMLRVMSRYGGNFASISNDEFVVGFNIVKREANHIFL